MAAAKINKMFFPGEFFRFVNFQSFVEIEPRQDQSVREQALLFSRCWVHLACEQEAPQLRFWQSRVQRFLWFARDGRDHDGKPKGRDAHDSREDEAEAAQNPAEKLRASRTFEAYIRENRRPQRPQKDDVEGKARLAGPK